MVQAFKLLFFLSNIPATSLKYLIFTSNEETPHHVLNICFTFTIKLQKKAKNIKISY